MTDEHPISHEVEQLLNNQKASIDEAFARGYSQGRRAQLDEDTYYMDRVAELTKLLASAEAKIQELRAK